MRPGIFITGTDKGLGRALAQRFLQADWHVFGGRYTEDSAASGQAAPEHGMLTEVPLDVTDLASVSRAAQAVGELTDHVDVLINNAGVLSDRDGELEELDFSAVMQTFDVNACGPLRVVQQFLPLLERGASKLILNISSEVGSIEACAQTSWYGYCMSKAAVNMQSRILANYLGPRGFKMLAVHPGGMRTDMLPDWPRPPEEAANSIFELVQDPNLAGGALFVQFDGSALPF